MQRTLEPLTRQLHMVSLTRLSSLKPLLVLYPKEKRVQRGFDAARKTENDAVSNV
jgi:hypothetical protein